MLYVGTGVESGKTVDEDDAFEYAMERCGIAVVVADAPESDEFRAMLVEWFYSDNWEPVAS